MSLYMKPNPKLLTIASCALVFLILGFMVHWFFTLVAAVLSLAGWRVIKNG